MVTTAEDVTMVSDTVTSTSNTRGMSGFSKSSPVRTTVSCPVALLMPNHTTEVGLEGVAAMVNTMVGPSRSEASTGGPTAAPTAAFSPTERDWPTGTTGAKFPAAMVT
jgi:hypothetical protein